MLVAGGTLISCGQNSNPFIGNWKRITPPHPDDPTQGTTGLVIDAHTVDAIDASGNHTSSMPYTVNGNVAICQAMLGIQVKLTFTEPSSILMIPGNNTYNRV